MGISKFVALFTYSWLFGCFQFGAVMNKATLNICMHVFCGNMHSFLLSKQLGLELLVLIVSAHYLYKKLTYIILYFHHQFVRVQVAPHLYQHLLLSVFLILDVCWMCVVFHCDFNLCFPDDNCVYFPFIYLLW